MKEFLRKFSQILWVMIGVVPCSFAQTESANEYPPHELVDCILEGTGVKVQVPRYQLSMAAVVSTVHITDLWDSYRGRKRVIDWKAEWNEHFFQLTTPSLIDLFHRLRGEILERVPTETQDLATGVIAAALHDLEDMHLKMGEELWKEFEDHLKVGDVALEKLIKQFRLNIPIKDKKYPNDPVGSEAALNLGQDIIVNAVMTVPFQKYLSEHGGEVFAKLMANKEFADHPAIKRQMKALQKQKPKEKTLHTPSSAPRLITPVNSQPAAPQIFRSAPQSKEIRSIAQTFEAIRSRVPDANKALIRPRLEDFNKRAKTIAPDRETQVHQELKNLLEELQKQASSNAASTPHLTTLEILERLKQILGQPEISRVNQPQPVLAKSQSEEKKPAVKDQAPHREVVPVAPTEQGESFFSLKLRGRAIAEGNASFLFTYEYQALEALQASIKNKSSKTPDQTDVLNKIDIKMRGRIGQTVEDWSRLTSTVSLSTGSAKFISAQPIDTQRAVFEQLSTETNQLLNGGHFGNAYAREYLSKLTVLPIKVKLGSVQGEIRMYGYVADKKVVILKVLKKENDSDAEAMKIYKNLDVPVGPIEITGSKGKAGGILLKIPQR